MDDQFTPSLLASARVPRLPEAFYYIPNFITEEEERRILQKARLTPHALRQLPPNRWTHLAKRRLQAHPGTLTASSTLLAAPLPPYLETPIVPRLRALGVFAHVTTARDHNDARPRRSSNGSSPSAAPTTATPLETGDPVTIATPHARPNHVLVNEYAPGQGIMPHEDGAAYAPVVATVSLGGHGVLELWPKPATGPAAHPPRSGSHEAGMPKDGHEEEVEAEAEGPVGVATNDGRHGRGSGRGASVGAEGRERQQSEPLARILQEPRSLLVTTGLAYETVLHGISPRSVDRGLVPASYVTSKADGTGGTSETGAGGIGGEEGFVANIDLLADPDRYIGDEHGDVERGTRVSLTYRDVLKVSKAGSKILGMGRR